MFPVDMSEIHVLTVFRYMYNASRMFNSLPANRRMTTNCKTSVFNKKVNSYLQTIHVFPIVWLQKYKIKWCAMRGGLDR